MSAVDDYRKAQEAEYGEFIATEPIYVGSALAYNVGDPVPRSNVEAHGYLADKVVARRATKAAASARAEAAGEPH